MDLTMETLHRPYEQGDFIAQLIAAGVPQTSIDQMLGGGHGAELLRWLHGDIEQNEARILGGERHTRVVGVIITDGEQVLVERDPDFGPGRLYAFGGQVRFDEEPQAAALREVQEETSLGVDAGRLVLLSQTQVVGGESEKLPGVRSPRQITQFLLRIDRFEAVPGQVSGLYAGSDGQRHDLLVLRIGEALTDARLHPAYRATLQESLGVPLT